MSIDTCYCNACRVAREKDAEIKQIRAAIKPFAELARGFDYFSASDKLHLAAGLTVGDLRRLRDAYDGEEDECDKITVVDTGDELHQVLGEALAKGRES